MCSPQCAAYIRGNAPCIHTCGRRRKKTANDFVTIIRKHRWAIYDDTLALYSLFFSGEMCIFSGDKILCLAICVHSAGTANKRIRFSLSSLLLLTALLNGPPATLPIELWAEASPPRKLTRQESVPTIYEASPETLLLGLAAFIRVKRDIS